MVTFLYDFTLKFIMDSFKFIAKQRLKSMFINIRSQNPNVKTFILVLDQKTIKIVSSFLKMSE
mgnify:CR=1 FL=1